MVSGTIPVLERFTSLVEVAVGLLPTSPPVPVQVMWVAAVVKLVGQVALGIVVTVLASTAQSMLTGSVEAAGLGLAVHTGASGGVLMMVRLCQPTEI